MKYPDFEAIMSPQRMNRYKRACAGKTRKALTLYRYNLRLSQEMFTIISCFEVALRNKINEHYRQTLDNEWLKKEAAHGGCFDSRQCYLTKQNIHEVLNQLGRQYTHHKLVAEFGFGFWRYLFAKHQYRAAGRTLLQIFPNKPTSSASAQYNNKYVFNELFQINDIRNRIAHHEPICFRLGQAIIDTDYVMDRYQRIQNLFHWMDIDAQALLFGLDHIRNIEGKILELR